MKKYKMRISDLSVGDWVLFDERPRQIISLFGDTGQVVLNDIDITEWPEEDKAYYSPVTYIENLEPIPVDERFLKENNFKQIENGDWLIDGFHYKANELSLYTWKPWSGDNGLIYITDIEFVHELQHFLRLRGVDRGIITDYYEEED